MALYLKYKAHVENGEVKIQNRRWFNSDMKQYFEGKDILIEVKKFRKTRSLLQNGYYHCIVINEVMEGFVDIGYNRIDLSHDIVHEYLKSKFLKKESVNEETGEVLVLPVSTTELTTTEMMVYIDDITQWASEYLGIAITPPEKQSELNF